MSLRTPRLTMSIAPLPIAVMPIAAVSIAALVMLTGCSGPTEPAAAPSSAPAVDAGGGAAVAAYLTSDCATVSASIASDEPPADAQGLDGVFVTLGPEGVPAISISDRAPDAAVLQTLDLSQGKGDAVAPGDSVTVNYCGVGLTSRQIFDSSWVRGEPISFSLDGLIQGWIDGMPGMRVVASGSS